MTEDNIWERAIGLTDSIFHLSSGLDLPRGDQWPAIVTVSLSQSNQRLDSVRILLDKNYLDSGVIITRALFELAVNLTYIAKNVQKRLPHYLRHSSIPTTIEEAERLQQEVDSGSHPSMREVIPGRAWQSLKDMCSDLGVDWLEEYNTFYRYASVPTHAGGFTLGSNYKELLDGQSSSARKRIITLLTASDFHLRVTDIAGRTFPEEIDLEKVKRLRDECDLLLQEIAEP